MEEGEGRQDVEENKEGRRWMNQEEDETLRRTGLEVFGRGRRASLMEL
jgi:hypothetical protein